MIDLLAIILIVGIVALILGVNWEWILTCEDFRIAGYGGIISHPSITIVG